MNHSNYQLMRFALKDGIGSIQDVRWWQHFGHIKEK